ncbi:MAG: DUF72 domain-containing protein [Hyphomicrobiales bacterium]|nr:DUF72 domain-containing protein [Hyphomicrobiales bacterium]
MAKAAKKIDNKSGRIRVGVGGWTYEPWRGTFFPKGLPHARELEHASGRLTSIEINGTFYRTQTPASFAKWRDETPDDFVFAVKAPRYVVQKRELASTAESISRFVESGLSELKAKLGPILWQFAPTKKFMSEDFAAFLDLLPREIGGRPVRHALEVRHETFLCAEFADLARKRGAAIVTACDSKYPEIADLTADFAYLRVMGATDKAKLGYAPKALDLWAERAKALAAGGRLEGAPAVSTTHDARARDVFFYFISGFKERNPAAAEALLERLR